MNELLRIFSASGRLSPPAFAAAAGMVYIAGLASQILTAPDVLARTGLWPFVLTQAILIWMWVAVHASRLRDAGLGISPAVGVAAIYALSVVLLLIFATAFFSAPPPQGETGAASLPSLLLVVAVFSLLLGGSEYGVVWVVVAILIAAAFVPPLLALGFSIWTATRPSVVARAA